MIDDSYEKKNKCDVRLLKLFFAISWLQFGILLRKKYFLSHSHSTGTLCERLLAWLLVWSHKRELCQTIESNKERCGNRVAQENKVHFAGSACFIMLERKKQHHLTYKRYVTFDITHGSLSHPLFVFTLTVNLTRYVPPTNRPTDRIEGGNRTSARLCQVWMLS